MKIVLAAIGVEDCRSPAWGHMVKSLESMGHNVFAVDPSDLNRFATKLQPEDQWNWVLENTHPKVVISVEGEHSAWLAESINAHDIHHLSLPQVVGVHPPTLRQPMRQRVSKAKHASIAFGNASPSRIQSAIKILDGGVDLGVYGDGWDEVIELQGRSYGWPLYSLTGALIADAQEVIVWADVAESSRVSEQQSALDVLCVGTRLRYLDAAQSFGALSPDQIWTSIWQSMGIDVETRIEVKKDGPKVSVVTAAYNIERFIGPTIESILNQTDDDLELIICHDGSKDATRSVIAKYEGDQRLRVIDQNNVGQTGRIDWVFNRSIKEARGEYISLIGGDDYAFEDRNERQLEVFDEDTEIDIVHSGGRLIKDGGDGRLLFQIPESYDDSSILRLLVKTNPIASPTLMARRRAFERYGLFTAGFTQDYDFFFKAARGARFRYLPYATTGYRVHEGNISAGLSSDVGDAQGRLRRRTEADRTTLAELYPSLQWSGDKSAWAAAWTDLGIAYLENWTEPDRALTYFENAIKAGGPSRIYVNVAVAHLIARNADEARKALAKAKQGDRSLSNLQLEGLGSTVMIEGPTISSVPFTLPLEIAQQTRCWDGTFVSRKRILLAVDWMRLTQALPFIQEFANTFSINDDVDLVLPTLGVPPQFALHEFFAALPNDLDLEKVGTITIERWEDISFLPGQRFAGFADARANRNLPDQSAVWTKALQDLRAVVTPTAN